MIAQVDLLDLVAVSLATLGIIMTAIISIGAILIDQFDKKLDFRFARIDEQRAEGQNRAAEDMRAFVERHERELNSFRDLERDLNTFKEMLPTLVNRDELKTAISNLEESLDEIRSLIVTYTRRNN